MASINTTPPIRNDDTRNYRNDDTRTYRNDDTRNYRTDERQFPSMLIGMSSEPSSNLHTLTHRSSFLSLRHYPKRLSSSSNGATTTSAMDNDTELYLMRSRSGTSISSVSSSSFLKEINSNFNSSNSFSIINNNIAQQQQQQHQQQQLQQQQQQQQKITTLKKLFVVKPINNVSSLRNDSLAENDSLTVIDGFEYLFFNNNHSKHIMKRSMSNSNMQSFNSDSSLKAESGNCFESISFNCSQSNILDTFDETASYNTFLAKCHANLASNTNNGRVSNSSISSGHINGGNSSIGSYYNNNNVITVNNSYNIQDSSNNNVFTVNNTYTINKLKTKRSFIFKNSLSTSGNINPEPLNNNLSLISEPKGFRTMMNAKKNHLKRYKSTPTLRTQLGSPTLSVNTSYYHNHNGTNSSSASSINTITSASSAIHSAGGVAYNTTKSLGAASAAAAATTLPAPVVGSCSGSSSPLIQEGFRAYSTGNIPLDLGMGSKQSLLNSSESNKGSRLSVSSDSSSSSSVSVVSHFQTPSLMNEN